MKRIFSLKALFAVCAMALILPAVLFADQKQVSIHVDGLSCPFCAFGLEKKLKSIAGVEKLEIKVNEGLAILTFKGDAKIDEELIAKKVKEAGFTPGEIRIGSNSEKEVETISGEKISLSIKGMACEGCVSRVANALKQVDCVREVKVDLEKGRATFLCTNAKFDKTKFVQTINDLGFKAELEKK